MSARALFQLPREDIPLELHGIVEKFEQRIAELDDRALQSLRTALAEPSKSRQFAKTVALSDYAADVMIKYPEVLSALLESGDLLRDFDIYDYRQALQQRLAAVDVLDSSQLSKCLRQFRAAEMLRLIWRDQNRLCTMPQLTRELSVLAEVCLQQALDFHYQALCQDCGTPVDDDGQPIGLIVIGMGKLGAYELNLSSDIDLIFAYPQSGEVEHRGRRTSHQEFFIQLGRRLIKTIDERTADGFVFRVDMRLRPYGDSGALVHSFAALEEYYQNQGRDWERYAMIKARVVAGDVDAGRWLMQSLRPFTYRRYIDFSVIESLRSMKNMIVREVNRKRLQDNIKLGAGGIREVEFVAQVFQLIHGGRDKNLQQRGLLDVLAELQQRSLLPVAVVEELQEAYHFLRDIEHALQAEHDQQTQSLPANDTSRARIAMAMGFDNWSLFQEQLTKHRENVRKHFASVIAAEEVDEPEEVTAHSLWEDIEKAADGRTEVIDSAVEGQQSDADGDILTTLSEFKFSDRVVQLQAIARERLDKVMPVLIAQLEHSEQPAEALRRTLEVIDAVLRRSAYLVLLYENPLALKHLVQLCAGSIYITRKLVQHPLLLDELIDPRTLYHAPDREEVRSNLRQHMLRIDPQDTESQMEQLRYFKRSHSLRVAAAELSGSLPLMKVSDFLTFIAEALLDHVLELAWHDISNKYGVLPGTDADNKQFMIAAYGKLGGLELSHGSDLDLVFIYDAQSNAVSDGAVALDSATYYTRLGQRIIHLLSTRTALGMVYDIDMRLRPSGNSGLLVSSCQGFVKYQNEKAWTWEHQALVRARPVAGDARLHDWFRSTRCELLTRERSREDLREQVTEMREKMRDHLTKELEPGQFHLKHSPGGIVDIEFMVQYAVLMHSAAEPRVCEFTDNIRILDALQLVGLLTEQRAEELRTAYIAYRACLHQRNLQDQDSIVDSAQFDTQIQAVRAAWRALLEE